MTVGSEELTIHVSPEVIDVIAQRVVEVLDERQAQPEPWIGVAEAAEHLHCRPQRIYALVHQGRLQPCREGSRLLFRRSQLDAWLLAGPGVEPRPSRRNGIRNGR